jgi:hypothetical protein
MNSGPYRLYFYSHEGNEPPHIHVDRDDWSAKFWLEPVALAVNLGFIVAADRRNRDGKLGHPERGMAWLPRNLGPASV